MLAMIEPTDDALRDWLLGRLPATQAEALEQRVLSDDAFGARLAEAETDLLDDLAANRLAPDARASALARFTATSHARWRLRIARALARFAPSARASHRARAGAPHRVSARRRWLGSALGALAAIAVVAIGVRVYMPKTADATITLLADRQRGAASDAFAVPRAATVVRLQVEVADADAATRYALDVADGARVVFHDDALAVRTAGPYRFVEARVPRSALEPGERKVTVHASGVPTAAASVSLTIRDE
jgi:hypothetical protein